MPPFGGFSALSHWDSRMLESHWWGGKLCLPARHDPRKVGDSRMERWINWLIDGWALDLAGLDGCIYGWVSAGPSSWFHVVQQRAQQQQQQQQHQKFSRINNQAAFIWFVGIILWSVGSIIISVYPSAPKWHNHVFICYLKMTLNSPTDIPVSYTNRSPSVSWPPLTRPLSLC